MSAPLDDSLRTGLQTRESLSIRLFYLIYRLIAWPLLRGVFEISARFVPKIAKGLELRESINGRAPWVKSLPPSPPTVWFHCSSGEFEYAKPVITLLKQQAPAIKVVVSFFSPTFADQIRTFQGVDWVVPLPWDTPRAISEFLNSYRPFALLIARTDVWPEMSRQVRIRNLSSVLFSATLTPNSGRTRGIGRWATRATLSQLNAIFCVTDEDTEQFRALTLGATQVSRQGDTRYDQVLARLTSPKPVRDEIFAAIPEGLSRLVCGSTWPEDESVLIPALAHAKDFMCGILVPHEPTPEHIADLEEKLRAEGLAPVRYSAGDAAEKMRNPGACLIVDRTGILAELYLKATWAFVGGSFRKTVHSVMEPLAAGCVTFVGPLHLNNREAVAFQRLSLETSPDARDSVSYVTQVDSSEVLVTKWRLLRTLPDTKSLIREAVRARTGSSQTLVDWILSRQ